MITLTVNHASLNHSSTEFQAILSKYNTLRNSVLHENYGFISLPNNQQIVEEIEKKLVTHKERFSHIVILGIGGSSLGGRMLVDSLSYNHGKKIIFLENVDPYEISGILARIPLINTLFLVVSKSGKTPETMAQFLLFKKALRNIGLKPQNHMILITDPKSGPLREAVQMDGYISFDVPQNVGGRFSVLSAVGLVLGYLINIDNRRLLHGAGSILSQLYQNEPSECLAFMLASMQYSEYQKGKTIHALMPYSERLKRFGDWYIQLLAESIGKRKDVGITPLRCTGTTDQHSILQLFQDGPNDKLIMFMHISHHGKQIDIPDNHFHELGFLNGHTFNELMDAEYMGTRDALTSADVPNLTLNVGEITPFAIGELIMLFELSTAFLGEFFGVDAFNQPGVEESKARAKGYLERKLA